MIEEMINIGDLIRIKESTKTGRYPRPYTGEQTITGVVISLTHSEGQFGNISDYWVNVVFLDGSKATLFHDEVKVLVTHESR